MSSFATITNASLELAGNPFMASGTNTYELFYKPQQAVENFFNDCVKLNLSVVRVFLFGDGISKPGGKIRNENDDLVWIWDVDPGNGSIIFNDNTQTGLGRFDKVVESARVHGIKLIPCLSNNWFEFGGVDTFVDRFAVEKSHSSFFAEEQVVQSFKRLVHHILHRNNTLTHTLYKDDPTILAWDLINEPRCKGNNPYYPRGLNCTAETISVWLKDILSFTKAEDTNHLVTFADEGFFNSNKTPRSYPGCLDYLTDGSQGDYEANAQLVDIIGIHLYLNQWCPDLDKESFIANSLGYFSDHLQVARAMGKPFFVSEFGFNNSAFRDNVTPIFKSKFAKEGLSLSLSWNLQARTGENCTASEDLYQFCIDRPM